MAGYTSIAVKNNDLIRKALQGSVFIAPVSTTALTMATLFDATTGDLKSPIVTGYVDLGWTTDDGAVASRSVDRTTITGWGSNLPLRTDITGDTKTVKVVCQETKAQTLALFSGVTVASLTPDATNGVVEIAEPLIAAQLSYRLLVLAVDEDNDGEFVIADFYPNAQVTDFGDQSFDKADPILFDVTFTAYEDATLGYARVRWVGGAGNLAKQTAMGF